MAAAVPAPTAVTDCNFTSIHANVRPPKTLHTHGVIPHWAAESVMKMSKLFY